MSEGLIVATTMTRSLPLRILHRRADGASGLGSSCQNVARNSASVRTRLVCPGEQTAPGVPRSHRRTGRDAPYPTLHHEQHRDLRQQQIHSRDGAQRIGPRQCSQALAEGAIAYPAAAALVRGIFVGYGNAAAEPDAPALPFSSCGPSSLSSPRWSPESRRFVGPLLLAVVAGSSRQLRRGPVASSRIEVRFQWKI